MFVDRYNFSINKGHVINIGLDNYFIDKSTNKNAIDHHIKSLVSNNKFILCVSHLYPYKNIIRLLQSFKAVLDQAKHHINLVVAGSMDYNNYNNRVLKCIGDLKLTNNVILLGRASKGNLKYLYCSCDFLVFPLHVSYIYWIGALALFSAIRIDRQNKSDLNKKHSLC